MTASEERLPPQSIEAEQSVLGAMLIERDAILRAADVLTGEDFYREAHRWVFEAILALFDRSEPVDMVTVAEELRQRGRLDAVGGVEYIEHLAHVVPTAANVEYYARIVEEKALLRQLIGVGTEIVRRAYEGQEDAASLMDAAENLVFSLGLKRRNRPYAALKDVLIDAFEHIEHLYMNRGSVLGVPTGFTEFDQLTSGLHPSELVILAARPSQGKTALCLNVARHAAIQKRIPTAIFSLEMSREQLAQRLLCAEAKVDGHRLRTGHLTEDDWRPLSRALGRLSEAPIFIDDTPNISLMELRAKARRLKAEHDVGLVIVDYLQLMHLRGRSESRQQEISEISRSLKALARELQVPILALSQLSRAVEMRQDRKPQLSDLRESGAIEQDADVVIFIYQRPERENENVVDLILAKQRNGPTGTVQLYFHKQYGRFDDLERHREVGA
ncbi:MAG: replicative DNA helicase [Clostridia bacterium]|nr:replicative DNA helicase [Clostridia bacterium]